MDRGPSGSLAPGLAEYTENQYIRRCGPDKDFEWDRAKEQANRRKHRVDFRTAARVFLDPHAIELDDVEISDEERFNVIGLVDGRMLFVTYTITGEAIRIISARGAEPHEKRRYHEIQA